MIRQEAVILIRYVKALCPQQKFDEYSPDAWYDVFRDYTLDEAQAAAAKCAAHKPFIAPAEIITVIREARADRIAHANPIYHGNPDETGAQSAANIRTLVTHAAAGQLPGKAVTAAIESGASYSHDGKLRAVAAIVGRTVPGPGTPLGRTLAIGCPHCGAEPREHCHGASGRRNKNPHASRWEAAGLRPQLLSGRDEREAS